MAGIIFYSTTNNWCTSSSKMGNELNDDNDRLEHQKSASTTCPPRPVIPPTTNTLSYAASKTLAKKLLLPDRERWQVPVEDVYMEGHLIIYIKTKSLLLDWYSNVKKRPLTLTRRGFLVIYMKGNKGYILDVAAAKSIECTTYRHGENSDFRTHIKLRYRFGNVHLWGFVQNGFAWKLALQRAYERSIPPYRPSVVTPKRVIFPQTEEPMKYKETKENKVHEFPAQVIESEYLATELRPIAQMESAVSWKSVSDWTTETEKSYRKEKPIEDFPLKLRDATMNIPSVTQMQRVRRFFRKSLPIADRTVSAPHSLHEPIVEEPPAKAALFATSTNELKKKDSSTPKQTVAEIRAILERTFSTRPPSNEKKGPYRWIKKTTGSPEKANIETVESMTTIEYGKALGWGRPMIGTDSETNV